jgi:hypothetical protein
VFGLERTFRWGFDILGAIISAIAFAALGALVVIFAPGPTRRVSDAVVARPWNAAGVGCLTLILVPILAILLVITLIGTPIAFLLGVIAVIAWIFGWIAVGYLAGERILRAFRARDILPVLAVIVGIVVLMLVSQVPVIGWLVTCLVGLFGIGAVVLTRFGTRVYPAPPVMAMAAAGPAVPGTYTPTPVDVAAWEARAREAQSTESAQTTSPEPPAASAEPPQPTDTPTSSPEDSGDKPAGSPPPETPAA